jgi:hypothetical protein
VNDRSIMVAKGTLSQSDIVDLGNTEDRKCITGIIIPSREKATFYA